MHPQSATTPGFRGRTAAAAPLTGRSGWDANGRTSPGASGSVFWAVVATVVAVSAVALGNGGPPAPSFIYGIDDSNILYEMDLVARTSGSVGPTPLTGVSNALAFDTARQDLFAVDGGNNLWWWNHGTAQYSLIASPLQLGITASSNDQPWSAAYYDNSYWFFVGGVPGNTLLGTNQLRKVSLEYSGTLPPTVTGFATYVVPEITGSNAFGDIAIAATGPNAGKLYAYTYADPGKFYSLDLNTIASGTSGYNLINTTSGTGLQIAFDPNYEILYGHNYTDGTWYTVSTSNGTLSPVLTQSGTFTTITGGAGGFRDLGGSSVQAVPEPGGFVLVAMASGPLVWWLARRRRQQMTAKDDATEPMPETAAPLELACSA